MTFEQPKLNNGSIYHVYNRANGKDNLFTTEADYRQFIMLLEKYIAPVADIYAWVLLSNHFHLSIQVKENVVYKYSKDDFKTNPYDWEKFKWQTRFDPMAAGNGPRIPNATNHFAHLFNAYAKYFNKKYERHGNLFQRPFKRKLIETDSYHRQVILYVHCNAVHHGFVSNVVDYPWTSYHEYVVDQPTIISKSEIMNLFHDIKSFQEAHETYALQQGVDDAWLIED